MDAKKVMEFASKFDPMEIARIIGEPKRPDKKMPYFINDIAAFDTAMPEEYTYYYDVINGEDRIYVVDSDGVITQREVTPDTPTLLTFNAIQSPGYFVKLINLMDAKEATIARMKANITRAMDKHECAKVTALMAAATSSTGNEHTLGSGQTRFRFVDLLDMIEDVTDYGDNLKLIAGSEIAKDVQRWNYDEDKNQALSLEDLGVEMVRVGLKSAARTYSLDADNSGGLVSTDVLASDVAYLVARDTEADMSPILFVRKKVSASEDFGKLDTESIGDQPERFVISLNGIVNKLSASESYLGVEFVGIEQFVAVCRNIYAFSKFSRT